MVCGTERAGKNLLLKAGNFPAFAAKLIFQNLIYKAVVKGVSTVTVVYVDTAAGGLAVTATGQDISVDFGGDTVTAEDIKAAIEAAAAVAALVTVKCFVSNTVTQVIQAVGSLAGGKAATIGFETIGGLRSKSITINNEAIDVTTHDSDQYKQILDEAGIRNFALTGSGVMSSAANIEYLQQAVINGTLLEMKLIDDAALKQFHGMFKATSFEEAGEYNGEQTYTLSLESSGEVVIGDIV